MDPQDPRRDFSVPIPVRVERADGTETREYAVNISPRGVCLHHGAMLDVGERISVTFDLPPEGTPVRAAGRVVWTNADGEHKGELRESGVHLQELSEEVRDRLLAFASQPVNRRR